MKIKYVTAIKAEGSEWIRVVRDIEKIELIMNSGLPWYRVYDFYGRYQDFNARYVKQIEYGFEEIKR